jgi:hypothetical protein
MSRYFFSEIKLVSPIPAAQDLANDEANERCGEGSDAF